MLIPAILIGLFNVVQPAQGPVTWTTAAVTGADGSVRLEIQAHVEDGWHIYATTLERNDGPIPTSFRFEQSKDYVAVGELVEPRAEERYDGNFDMRVRQHHGEPRFVLHIDPAVQTPFVVKGEVEYMACNSKTCLPPVMVSFEIEVNPSTK